MSLDFFASERQSLISKDTPCYCMDEKIHLAHEQIINFIDFINSAKKDRHNIYAYSD